MAKVEASAERTIDAPAGTVYGYLADMRVRQQILPPAFSGFQVEEGGTGAGTVTRFTVTAGGRSREYRMRVTEPVPGRTLVETDTGSSLVTTFDVEPREGKSLVRITTNWDGAGGVGGFFERAFAPRALRPVYEDALARLDAYAREHAAAAPGNDAS
jgi:uncharacterized protein YndB with AHSA1/START domain